MKTGEEAAALRAAQLRAVVRDLGFEIDFDRIELAFVRRKYFLLWRVEDYLRHLANQASLGTVQAEEIEDFKIMAAAMRAEVGL